MATAKKIKKLDQIKESSKDKKVIESNVVDGLKWWKESHMKWDKVIGRTGILIQDEIHQSKLGETKLKAGTVVTVNDLRGRVLPQYRVKDPNGRVWFVRTDNVKFNEEIYKTDEKFVKEELDKTWSAPDPKNWRFEKPISSKEEKELLKKKKKYDDEIIKRADKILNSNKENKNG